MKILSEEPIVSVTCTEPEGEIVRNVRFMDLSPENLQLFWEKSRKFNTLFSSQITNFQQFINLFVNQGVNGITSNGLFWVVDDFVGVFYLTEIMPKVDALVHYSFFDGRHRGRQDLTRAMLKYVFEEFGFRRLTAEIPYYVSKHTFIYVERVGFKKEGRKRKSAFFNNSWFDTNCYGILREDILDGCKA